MNISTKLRWYFRQQWQCYLLAMVTLCAKKRGQKRAPVIIGPK